MAHFKRDYHELFLGVIRKYMQVRGPMSQKDLAEIIEVGVSTVSRFLNQKTRELDPQLMAKIVAKLNIPLHEVIDFVEEDYGERFIKLVKYLKDEGPIVEERTGSHRILEDAFDKDQDHEENMEDAEGDLKGAGPKEKESPGDQDKAKIQATPKTGKSEVKESPSFEKKGNVTSSFNVPNSEEVKKAPVMKDKLERLSPRQKAYLTDFLDLDVEGKDLVVDVGNSLFRYFKQRGMEF